MVWCGYVLNPSRALARASRTNCWRRCADIYATKQQLQNNHLNGDRHGLCFQILASQVPGIFNLGGDLVLFSEPSNQAVRGIRQRYQPVHYQELLDITEFWMDAALQLKEKDLRTMERLAHSQSRLMQMPVVERRAPDFPLRIKP
jgi:hypothetical protein